MVKIRLTRLGKHKDPFYRIVATDSRTKRDGGFIAVLGTYEPFSGKTLLKSEEILDFLKKGAQPTDTVLNLFKTNGIWAEFLKNKKTSKKNKRPKKAKKTIEKKLAKKEAKKSKPVQKPVEKLVEEKPTTTVEPNKEENK